MGILAGVISSALGGMAAAVTRFIIHAADPVTISVFRFGLGFLFLLPVALALRSRWPRGRDWIGVAALGVMFYGAFFVVYAEALVYTTAARGSLAISTLPLLTMIVAALLGREKLTVRKSVGVFRRHGRRGARARSGPGRGAAGSLARRPDDDRRHVLDGALQRAVASLHAALERARLCHCGDGFWVWLEFPCGLTK